MGSTMNRALLFLAGGVAAAAVTAYMAGALDPYLGSQPAAVSSSPDAGAPQADVKEDRLPGASEAPDTASEPVGETEAPVEQAAEAKPASGENTEAPAAPVKTPEVAAKVLAPSFDLVRAEADGSLVIAGKAAPQAKVEIVVGAKVIGNATAGAEGDFAVVIDQPLKPGDHQIVLRSTNPDNVVSTSPETAIVSIPENRNGQVLALVEQPGAPSKLISVPEPENAASTQSQATSGDAAPSASATPSEAEPSAQQPEQQAAATPDSGSSSAAAQNPAVADKPTVKVEAVEIEGRKVFVAGVSDPGRKVRAYANDILLGEVVTSPGGRFLIETERDLPAGDYIIRVDALEPDGVKVVARAAVPFEREAGEAQSAVAPEAGQPSSGAAAEAKPSEGTSSETAKPEVNSGEVAAAAPEVLAPKLQNVDGAVIIRRGDSLWRISRRVYGLGVRYSTIYLANQDQIRDPNRIWPGQVFKVPEKTPHGEAANMKAVGEQATTVPQ
jgi:nucleoid-associated protein YgaU